MTWIPLTGLVLGALGLALVDTVVAPDARTAATTTWELADTDAPYLALWITDLDGRAHVNEVKAS